MKKQEVEALAAASFALSTALLRGLLTSGALSGAQARRVVESALADLRVQYGVAPADLADGLAADSIDVDELLEAAHEMDAERLLRGLLNAVPEAARRGPADG